VRYTRIAHEQVQSTNWLLCGSQSRSQQAKRACTTNSPETIHDQSADTFVSEEEHKGWVLGLKDGSTWGGWWSAELQYVRSMHLSSLGARLCTLHCRVLPIAAPAPATRIFDDHLHSWYRQV